LEGHCVNAATTSIGDVNSEALIARVLSCVRGLQPVVLLHPRWTAHISADAARRAGVGTVRRDDVAVVVFTSGSTAAPKAIAHTWTSLQHSARSSNAHVPFGPGDRWLLSLPVCHVGGLMIVLRAEVGGGGVVLPAPGQSLRDALCALLPSHVSLVPTQLMRLLNDDDATRALAGCAEILVGGAPLSQALRDRSAQRGVRIRQTWGMTETAAQVCTSQRGRAETCGQPVPGMEVRVDGGRLRVRGASMCAGVLDADDPLRVVSVVDGDGWFDTKDTARMTAEGLVIDGRSDRQFTRGGENVHPDAVAKLLSSADTHVWVVAVPDDEWGHVPVAFFDAVSANADDAAKMLSQIARKKCPVFMRPVAYLPVPASLLPKPPLSALQAAAIAFLQEKNT
jgi:o-succinylbenzoate---CoA ligase